MNLDDLKQRAEHRMRHPAWDNGDMIRELLVALRRTREERNRAEADRERLAAEKLQLQEQLAGAQMDKNRLQTALNEERQRCAIIEADCAKALDARDRLAAEVERLTQHREEWSKLALRRLGECEQLRAELDEARTYLDHIQSEANRIYEAYCEQFKLAAEANAELDEVRRALPQVSRETAATIRRVEEAHERTKDSKLVFGPGSAIPKAGAREEG